MARLHPFQSFCSYNKQQSIVPSTVRGNNRLIESTACITVIYRILGGLKKYFMMRYIHLCARQPTVHVRGLWCCGWRHCLPVTPQLRGFVHRGAGIQVSKTWWFYIVHWLLGVSVIEGCWSIVVEFQLLVSVTWFISPSPEEYPGPVQPVCAPKAVYIPIYSFSELCVCPEGGGGLDIGKY